MLGEFPGIELRHEQSKQESQMARIVEMDNQIDSGRGSSMDSSPYSLTHQWYQGKNS